MFHPWNYFFFFACLSFYLLQFSNQCSTSSSYGSVLLFLISIHFRTFFAFSSTFYFILLCFFCLTVLTNSLLPLWVSSDCTYLYIFYTHTVSCRPTKRFLIFYSWIILEWEIIIPHYSLFSFSFPAFNIIFYWFQFLGCALLVRF